MERHFEIAVPAPFRLDLTVWALRRRAHNQIDRFDAGCWRRVPVVAGRTVQDPTVPEGSGGGAMQSHLPDLRSPGSRGGATGYLSKDASPAEVVDAVEAVTRGEGYLQPALGAALARWQQMRERKSPHGFELTPREHEVLRLVAVGHTNGEIAAMLGVSLRTVETHRSHLSRRLGTTSRAELGEAAQELHLDPIPPSD